MRKIQTTLLLLLSIMAYSQSLNELYQQGLQAYEDQDYTLFHDKMAQINGLRPNYPAVVYNLAAAHSLLGNYEQAIMVLKNYVLMDATRDFTEDTDFTQLISQPLFQEIKKLQQQMMEEKEVDRAFEWNVQFSHPESITFSKKQNAYFVGGVRDGKIWKISKGKTAEVFAESNENSWSVMGLDISTDGRFLWACTSSMENYADFDQSMEGYASVIQYDLKTGKVENTFTLPGGHNFGDLIIHQDGGIYISDGIANKLYRVSVQAGALEEFLDLSETIFNLQGLTFNEDQTAIFVSDYINGIYKVDLQSKALTKLNILTEDSSPKGIDGLYFIDNSLIGLHNGTKPNRIVIYRLSEEDDHITEKETLVQGSTLGEPTQGIFVDGDFYYISNSPWPAYGNDGTFNPTDEKSIIGIIQF